MHNVRFETDKKIIHKPLPEKWNELTPAQVQFIAPRIFIGKKTYKLKSDILFYLLKLKEKYIRLMNMSQLDDLLPALDWLYDEPLLTINPFPIIKIEHSVFTGPKNELREFTTAQFAFADRFFTLFLKKKDEQYLNLFLGTLYYPANSRFKKENIEENAKVLKKWPFDKKLAVLLYYMGSRNISTQQNAEIFNKKNERSSRHSKSGWLGFFYRLAGPKIGNYEKVADMNFMDMLGIMREINEEAREIEKQNKRR